MIADCTLINNGGDGILLGPVSVAQVSNTSSNNNTGTGVKLATQVNLSLKDVVIDGCTCESNGTAGIALLNDYSGTRIQGCSIQANTCSDNGAYGILLDGGADASVLFCSICGNICNNNSTHGILLDTRIKYCTLSGNTCSNNRGDGTGSGIYADGAENDEVELNSITGNVCINDATDTLQTYGIYMGENTKDNVLIGNPCYGNATANIQDDGDDNDIAHNTGA